MRLPTLTRAATRLRAKLDARKPFASQSDLAVHLGVSKQAVNAWVTGKSRPDPTRMAAIQRLFGIPMSHWITEEP